MRRPAGSGSGVKAVKLPNAPHGDPRLAGSRAHDDNGAARPSGPFARRRRPPTPAAANRSLPRERVLRRALGPVLRTVLAGSWLGPFDALARAVRIARARVDDHVEGVEQPGVVPGSALGPVDLAVARTEAVVAPVAVQGVTDRIAECGDVAARERPQGVVSRTAVRRVDAAVREHAIVAATAARGVVARAARGDVAAAVACDAVGVGATVQAVEAVAADHGVLARPGERPVGARALAHVRLV